MNAFKYPLEPLREHAQWQLEAARLKLAQIEKSVIEAHRQLASAVEELSRVASQATEAEGGALDPARQRRLLDYLAQMRSRIDERKDALDGLKQAGEDARAECLKRQQKLDVTDAHRKTLAAAHAHLEVARGLREADQDWIARLHMSGAGKS